MSKFTPGPWEYDENSGYIFMEGGRQMVAEIRGFGGRLPMDDNGRLVAAAPEMYELLQKSLTQLSIHTVNAGVASDIQKLLNKIERSSK